MKNVQTGACAMLIFFIMSGCSRNRTTVLAEQVSGGNARKGKHLIYSYGCGTCHSIPGIGAANGTAGPPLRGFASRIYIAGVLQNTPENLARWITRPQEVVAGTAMPDLGITKDQAYDMAAYLYTLR